MDIIKDYIYSEEDFGEYYLNLMTSLKGQNVSLLMNK